MLHTGGEQNPDVIPCDSHSSNVMSGVVMGFPVCPVGIGVSVKPPVTAFSATPHEHSLAEVGDGRNVADCPGVPVRSVDFAKVERTFTASAHRSSIPDCRNRLC